VEIGCGTGKNTGFLSELGERILALDFSAAMVARAKEKLRTSNTMFAIADVTKRWPCRDQAANLVVCNLVLEHIQDLAFIFSESYRSLANGGLFFVCELHPFRQYQGTKANFEREREVKVIPAFVHHISEFLESAESQGFVLEHLKEWWHEADANKPPRLASFIFKKPRIS
jgi:ubiquinone/menaquinone biosynthesis C-methylase UbiE